MSTNFYTLRVNNIKQETSDTVSVSFEVPANLTNEFQYKAGQYLTLKFIINGKEERRAYSMSSSPIESHLTVTVKRVNKGIVSNYIADHLKLGDSVEVMPPQGKFCPNLDITNRKQYYLVAGGSGITPIMSMVKTIVEQEPQSIIALLYSNRNEENIIFKQQLDELQTRYANQLYVDYILSQPKREKSTGVFSFLQKGTINWQGKVGRINDDVLERWFMEQPAIHKDVSYYICGPEGMMSAVEHYVKNMVGAPQQQVHLEHFISGATTPKADNLQGAKVSVMLRGEQIDMIATQGKTILDMLVELKKDPPYSCTSGACSTCMAKVKSGTVKMDACFALDDSEVKAGYILTCQAHPTSSEVVISYDE